MAGLGDEPGAGADRRRSGRDRYRGPGLRQRLPREKRTVAPATSSAPAKSMKASNIRTGGFR
jgi:hypothetical protein